MNDAEDLIVEESPENLALNHPDLPVYYARINCGSKGDGLMIFEQPKYYPLELQEDQIAKELLHLKNNQEKREYLYTPIKTALLNQTVKSTYHSKEITSLQATLSTVLQLEHEYNEELSSLMEQYAYPLRPDIGQTFLEHTEAFLDSLREMETYCRENKVYYSNAGISIRQLQLLRSDAPKECYAKRIENDIDSLENHKEQIDILFSRNHSEAETALLQKEYSDTLMLLMQRYAYPTVSHKMLIQHAEAFMCMLDKMLQCCNNLDYQTDADLPNIQIKLLTSAPILYFAEQIADDITHLNEQKQQLETMYNNSEIEIATKSLKETCTHRSIFVDYLNALKKGNVPLTLECIKLYAETKHMTLCLWQHILNQSGQETNSLELLDKLFEENGRADMHILCGNDGQFCSLNVIPFIPEEQLAYSHDLPNRTHKTHENLRTIKELQHTNEKWHLDYETTTEPSNTENLRISANARTQMAVIISTNFQYALEHKNDEILSELSELSEILDNLLKEIKPQLEKLHNDYTKTGKIERAINDEDCQIYIKFTQKLSEIVKFIDPKCDEAKASMPILETLKVLTPYFVNMATKKSALNKNGYPYSGGTFSVQNPYQATENNAGPSVKILNH